MLLGFESDVYAKKNIMLFDFEINTYAENV